MTEDQDIDLFGKRLKYVREDIRKISQKELADKLKLPPSSVAHFEGGGRKPSFDNLKRLAEALEVTTDYLLGRTDELYASVAADPLYRHAAQLTDDDRAVAQLFFEALAAKRKDDSR